MAPNHNTTRQSRRRSKSTSTQARRRRRARRLEIALRSLAEQDGVDSGVESSTGGYDVGLEYQSLARSAGNDANLATSQYAMTGPIPEGYTTAPQDNRDSRVAGNMVSYEAYSGHDFRRSYSDRNRDNYPTTGGVSTHEGDSYLFDGLSYDSATGYADARHYEAQPAAVSRDGGLAYSDARFSTMTIDDSAGPLGSHDIATNNSGDGDGAAGLSYTGDDHALVHPTVSTESRGFATRQDNERPSPHYSVLVVMGSDTYV